MANDGSVASQVEDWLVTQIQAIEENSVAVFEESDVQPWEGTEQNAADQFADEVLGGHRNRIARVYFAEDSVTPLEGGEIKVVPTYVILTAVRNHRPGDARRGDTGAIGTNRLRDLLQAALHNKRPNITDGVSYTDKTNWLGSRVILNRKTGCIQRSIVTVDEVPAGA